MRITLCRPGRNYPGRKETIIRVKEDGKAAQYVTFGANISESYILKRLPLLIKNPDYKKAMRGGAYHL